jgi:cytochrome c peroxidase
MVAIDATSTNILVQTREPATLWLDDGRFLQLSTERHADVGHAIFHTQTGTLACASCHPEGGEDGRVWQLAPTGSRRTPSLRGGIGGTEPFHWDGDLATLSALVDDVWVGRMAGPPLAADQVAELRRWLDTIPALPRAPGDATVVARGRALFEDPTIACATCHTGALLTNNMTIDVGTGKALQVPSLRGLAWRAPYLHDGCAATLRARFGTCGGGDKHGHTSQLQPAQLDDLIAYLRSL